MNKLNKSVTRAVLSLLDTGGQGAVDFITFIYDVKRWGSHYKSQREYKNYLKYLKKKNHGREILYKLKQNKYVEVNKKGRTLMVRLTDKGKMLALRNRLFNCPSLSKKFTVVIFDIPETAHIARNLFRRLLKEAGFKLLQHSVWISNKDVRAVMINFIREQRIDKWVNVFYATDLFR